MLLQTPQHPIKESRKTVNMFPQKCKEAHHSLRVIYWINEVLGGVDSGYLRLHDDTMQTKWHQYIKYMCMLVEMLRKLMLEKSKKEHLTCSTKLMKN